MTRSINEIGNAVGNHYATTVGHSADDIVPRYTCYLSHIILDKRQTVYSLTNSLIAPPFRNLITIKVSLHGNPLHVDAGGRAVLVVERVLRGRNVARHLRDDAREGVARAMEMEALDAGLSRVLLQILDEAV